MGHCHLCIYEGLFLRSYTHGSFVGCFPFIQARVVLWSLLTFGARHFFERLVDIHFHCRYHLQSITCAFVLQLTGRPWYHSRSNDKGIANASVRLHSWTGELFTVFLSLLYFSLFSAWFQKPWKPKNVVLGFIR